MHTLGRLSRSRRGAWIVLPLTFSFLCNFAQPALAAGETGLPESVQCTTCEKKYNMGVAPLLLQEVKVTGAVTNAGLHYVPKGTDLTTLLVAAGGLRQDNAGEIVLRRGDKAYTFNADDVFRGKDRNGSVKVENQDIVYIPPEHPWISDGNLRFLQIIGTVLGVAVLAYGVSRR